MRQNRSTSFPKKSVHIENAALKICLFVKPVDTNEYLEWPSCHHCHDKKGLDLDLAAWRISSFDKKSWWFGKLAYEKEV